MLHEAAGQELRGALLHCYTFIREPCATGIASASQLLHALAEPVAHVNKRRTDIQGTVRIHIDHKNEFPLSCGRIDTGSGR